MLVIFIVLIGCGVVFWMLRDSYMQYKIHCVCDSTGRFCAWCRTRYPS